MLCMVPHGRERAQESLCVDSCRLCLPVFMFRNPHSIEEPGRGVKPRIRRYQTKWASDTTARPVGNASRVVGSHRRFYTGLA